MHARNGVNVIAGAERHDVWRLLPVFLAYIRHKTAGQSIDRDTTLRKCLIFDSVRRFAAAAAPLAMTAMEEWSSVPGPPARSKRPRGGTAVDIRWV